MTEQLRGNSQRRMLKVLAALMRGEELDRHSAARLLGVNHECAYRILDVLEEEVAGVVVIEGRPKRFAFNGGPAPTQGIRSGNALAEALAAALGAATAKAFSGTGYETELRNYRDRVIAAASRKHREMFSHVGRKLFVVGGQEELLEDKSELFDMAIDAVLRQREARVRYQHFDGQEEELLLKPFTLVVYDAHLYLVANGRNKPFHTYRFSRIREMEVLQRRFEYPSASEYSPATLFRDSLGVFLSPNPTLVRVRLQRKWATYASHHRWHPSQEVKPRPDGSFDLTMRVRPCHELEQWILRFGEDAEVIEPADLREKIAHRLGAASSAYEPAQSATRAKEQ